MFPPTRLVGVAGFLWLASTGLGEAEFAALARRFAAAHAEQRIMVAIDRLQRHMTVGDRVLVVTGCADPLATTICAQLGLDRVEIIAGSLRAGRTGMWPARGCRGSQKVRRLREAGVPLPVEYAYTDNLVDAPLLRAATHRYLIDPSRRDEARARRLLPHPVTVLSSPREDPDR